MRFRRLEALQVRQAATATPERDASRRRGTRTGTWFGLFLLLVIAALLGTWLWHRVWITTAGRVMAKEVRITTVEPSRLAAIHVKMGETVAAGAALVDAQWGVADLERERAVQKAEATLAVMQAEKESIATTGLEPNYAAAVEIETIELEGARAERRAAELVTPPVGGQYDAAPELAEVERQRRLLELRATTRKAYDEAVVRARRASAGRDGSARPVSPTTLAALDVKVRLAEQRLQQAKVRLLYAQQQFQTQLQRRDLEIEQAERHLDAARAISSRYTIATPIAARVGWIGRQPGDVVDKDDVVLTLQDPTDMWIEAYVQADDMADLSAGDLAKVRIDGIPGELIGAVSLIYPEQKLKFRDVEVGQQLVRSPSQLSNVYHTIRIDLDAFPAERAKLIDRVATVSIRRK